MTAEVYRAAGELMAERGHLQGVADEGGWWPAFVEQRGGARDAGARDRARRLRARRGRRRSRSTSPRRSSATTAAIASASNSANSTAMALAEMLLGWVARYPIVSIEDPFAEDDDDGMVAHSPPRSATACRSSATTIWSPARARARGGRRRERLQRRADQAEPGRHGHRDQSGAQTRHAAGFGTIVSARSGETEDVDDRLISPSAGTPAS